MKLKKILQVSFLAIILSVGIFNTANAIVAPSSSKAITAFTISNEVGTTTIDETAHTVTVSMPSGTDLSVLTPTITLSDIGASVSPLPGTQEDFTNPQIYTVTAADTTTQSYTVTVTDQPAPLSSDKTITSFTIVNEVGNTTIDNTAHTVSIIMPSGTDLTALTPTITLNDAGATINPTSGAIKDFTNPQIYTVAAADSTKQDYAITVTDQPAPVSITLKVYAGNTVLFDGQETVNACAESPEADAPITVNGKCALEQAPSSPALSPVWIWYDVNFHKDSDLPKTIGFLDKLGDTASDNNNFIYWGWFSNLTYGATSINSHLLSKDEELLLTYNSFPLRISASKNSGVVGDTITFTAEEKSTFNADFSDMVWTPSLGVSIALGTQSCATVVDGTCSIVLNTSGSFNAVGSKTLFVPSAKLPITVSSVQGNSGSGSGGVSVTPVFSVPNAISYLQSVQAPNGSFGGSDLYSDWAGVALGASGAGGTIRTNLLSYMTSHNTPSSLLTDNERRAIALLSLGQNPYAFSGTNYIASIVNKFDGTQFGDPSLVNDDIFALIPLASAGYTSNDDVISKDISFVLSKQQPDGSWNTDVDFTAAAVQALSPFRTASGVSDALTKASTFLQTSEQSDGGFGNISSSSWAIQAMNALGASWTKSGKTPANYLGAQQATDGAALPATETLSNRIWTTSYAIPAALGKPWSNIMQSVSKQENQNSSNNPNADLPKIPNAEPPTDTVACPPGDLFSVTTGQRCTTTILTPNSQSPVNSKTPKKQKKVFSLTKIKVAIKNTKTTKNNVADNITKPNLKNDASQNTASVINATEDFSPKTQTPAPKSWFARLLEFLGF
jgi:hypothetical protein